VKSTKQATPKEIRKKIIDFTLLDIAKGFNLDVINAKVLPTLVKDPENRDWYLKGLKNAKAQINRIIKINEVEEMNTKE